MTFDGKAFGEEIVEIVRAHIDRRTALLEEKLVWLQARLDRLEGLEPLAKSAKPATPKAVVRLAGPRGNGKDAQ